MRNSSAKRTQPEQPEQRSSAQATRGDSAPILAALGTLAYAASMLTHEALGHGAYCIAAGGHNTMLTAWGERCACPGMHGHGINAAGPGVQFAAGLLAWLALRRLPPRATRLRFFTWLTMTFNLFIASSYVAFSGITLIGDAAVLIAGLHPLIAWRAALILVGSALYYLSMHAAAAELHRFAAPNHALPRLFRLVSTPYAAAGLFACTTAALNHTMGPHVALGFAVASSFGSTSGLFGLPTLRDTHRTPTPPPNTPTTTLTWSTPWVTAATIVLALFLLFLGPGLQ